MEVLKNSTFEISDATPEIVGWTADQSETIAIDVQQAHTGDASLRLQNTTKKTVVRSNQFSPPDTGRLSFFVWLKMSDDFEGPLRMGIEG